MMEASTNFKAAFAAGGAAGLSVDMVLFPLDTLKTRLQSKQGFARAGGFRAIYSGIGSAAIGSIPTASLFFLTYEGVKTLLDFGLPPGSSIAPLIHSTAATFGEVMACLARVPTEVVKQRAQASPGMTTPMVFRQTLSAEGFRGFYRGYVSTVIREVPFSFLQFPMWEYIKYYWGKKQGHSVEAWQSGVAGALAGGLAAGITTPLDVAKTRIMLAEGGSPLAQGSILFAMSLVRKERGIPGLFAGLLPRVVWISIGGAIFLGVYDGVKQFVMERQNQRQR